VSADAAYCYDRVNHIVMSLVWLALTGYMPAIVVTLFCLQTMKFFQRTGFGDSKSFFGGLCHEPYMMGLGQGNHAAPPSWIQLSAVMANVYKQLDLGTDIHDPIADNRIHSMGAMFVDDLDLFTWKEAITEPIELMLQAQREVTQWSLLLNATRGALKPENVFGTCCTTTAMKESGTMQYIQILNYSLRTQTAPRAASGRKRYQHPKRLSV
jgi:hypothetical protein